MCVRWNIIQSVHNSVVFRPLVFCVFWPFRQRVAPNGWFEHVHDNVPQAPGRYPFQSQSDIQWNISALVLLCETAVCFLQDHDTGTIVRLRICITPPDVDFESDKSTGKSASWNNPTLHSFASFPTWQYCLYFPVGCEQSAWLIVCYKICSILSLILPNSGQSTRCQVCQYVRDTFIWELLEHIRLMILQLPPTLPFWYDDHPYVEWKRCVIVQLSCWQVHRTSRRMF